MQQNRGSRGSKKVNVKRRIGDKKPRKFAKIDEFLVIFGGEGKRENSRYASRGLDLPMCTLGEKSSQIVWRFMRYLVRTFLL